MPATVRQTAKKFGISKSTVHKDVTDRLQQIDPSLAAEARKILDLNKSERQIPVTEKITFSFLKYIHFSLLFYSLLMILKRPEAAFSSDIIKPLKRTYKKN